MMLLRITMLAAFAVMATSIATYNYYPVYKEQSIFVGLLAAHYITLWSSVVITRMIGDYIYRQKRSSKIPGTPIGAVKATLTPLSKQRRAQDHEAMQEYWSTTGKTRRLNEPPRNYNFRNVKPVNYAE